MTSADPTASLMQNSPHPKHARGIPWLFLFGGLCLTMTTTAGLMRMIETMMMMMMMVVAVAMKEPAV